MAKALVKLLLSSNGVVFVADLLDNSTRRIRLTTTTLETTCHRWISDAPIGIVYHPVNVLPITVPVC